MRVNRRIGGKMSYFANDGTNDDRAPELIKILVIGDSSVGKTSFVQRYANSKLIHEYKPTIGVDFAMKTVAWPTSNSFKEIKVQLWDIAGQERFTHMTRVYYKHAQGCIVMFDLSNRASFDNAKRWKEDVDQKCVREDGQAIPTILVGNKCDMLNRDVDIEEIQSLYKNFGFSGWTEISVHEGILIEESMRFLLEVILSDGYIRPSLKDTILKLHQKRERGPKKCGCFKYTWL